ncbi:MAG: UDP-N-acetylmuramoyl-L-alanyl-D-glutamate--2,6-diaminopimelate ligase [Bacteroidia bacterium]|nr:UDP-N-acetylmuramoyl-L-alanyl-D-glutamate--2,6-diaminopimelate ligase [Bacteroidia bacterium]
MVKLLSSLLKDLKVDEVTGNTDIYINQVCFDSRKAGKDDLFIAVPGTITDGHQYISQTVSNGVVAVVCEQMPAVKDPGVVYVRVNDTNTALALIAASYYDHPSEKLKLIGVTGTNGKTTIATLSYCLFTKLGFTAGLISTICNYVAGMTSIATHTTPDPLQINFLLNEMVEAGCEYCFMEVSSHSVVQKRIAGLNFTGGVFTNLTHDHLDYHKTFDEYLKAKKKFFDDLPSDAFALTNIDDRNGSVMIQNTKARKISYALKTDADFKCRILEHHFNGMSLVINDKETWTRFIGGFNAYNLLAVFAIAIIDGQKPEEVLPLMSSLVPVDGRFETLYSAEGIIAIVDYAHTPDAIRNVLSTISQIRRGDERVITVTGAGGDRDRTKRPVMAQIAAEMSNLVILTSDNPRSEDPAEIIEEMMKGIDISRKQKVAVIVNRSEAIKTACMMAVKNDIILVAGKGHETYQEISGIKHHFDDHEEIRKNLQIIN